MIVSTAEHTHALASLMAMNARQARVLREAAGPHRAGGAHDANVSKQMKVATQMGTQIHATDNYRRVVELIQSGAIGPVHEAHSWVEQGIEGPRQSPTGNSASSREVPLGPVARPGAIAALPSVLF